MHMDFETMRCLSPNYAMHTDSAITLRFQSAITGAEPVMANRWALQHRI